MVFQRPISGTNRDKGLVIQAYNTQSQAEQAIRALLDAGFTKDRISVVAKNDEVAKSVSNDMGTDTGIGTGIGALAGATLGAIGALLVGATAVALPGVGLVFGGPLAAALYGTAAGGITGGLVGALTGAGIDEADANQVNQRVSRGDIIVAVEAGMRDAEARRILNQPGMAPGAEAPGTHPVA